jgi:hypothetical protein
VAFVPKEDRRKDLFKHAQSPEQRFNTGMQRLSGKVAGEALALQNGDPEARLGTGDGRRGASRSATNDHDVEAARAGHGRPLEDSNVAPEKRSVLPP